MAAGNRHLSALRWAATFGGSVDWPCVTADESARNPAQESEDERRAPSASARSAGRGDLHSQLIIHGRMKRLVLFLTLAAGSATLLTAGAQSIESRLKQLFPSATSFSPKEGDPPHFTAYTGAARQDRGRLRVLDDGDSAARARLRRPHRHAGRPGHQRAR